MVEWQGDRGTEQRDGPQQARAFAVCRLRQAGFDAVADRLASGGVSWDRRPVCVAIMAAVDRVDCRRAAALDAVNAWRWQVVTDDQAQVMRAALAFDPVEIKG